MIRWLAVGSLGVLIAASACASTLFSENFESGSGLADGNWSTTGTAQIVTDPQNGANHALDFTGDISGGDIFSAAVSYTVGTTLTLSFDVLLTAGGSGSPEGWIGTDHNPHGNEQWLWNTGGTAAYNTSGAIVAGTWTHVSFSFIPFDPGSLGNLELKMEQNQGTTQHVFFDNILLTTVPEPTPIALTGVGLTALILFRRAFRFRRGVQG